ncbi:MAG: hypothetical protein ACKPCO_07525 [Actinomycetota bacterium]
MMQRFFDQLVRATDGQIGPHIPAHQRDEWPEAELYGVTFDNTIEWAWDGNQAFARWFEEDDTMELLVVVTSVDPFIDFTEALDRVGETLPANMEVEVSEPEPGSPVMIALTFAGFIDISDEDLAAEVEEFFEVAALITAKVTV